MTERYTAEQLRELLEGGALIADSIADRAAIHLLDGADLIGKRFLDQHISIESVELGGEQVTVAFIRDWSALARPADFPFLSPGERRCLELAACVAQSDICRTTARGVRVEPPLGIRVCHRWRR
ncbi:hypothetical protein AB0M22_31150 [Nocardia sp. NPDC051756]|uniref:hypothetical protein n=1 Tax=Nocardia sp. NPDC051756 TaxID=3154751 RepID=UPI003432BFE2